MGSQKLFRDRADAGRRLASHLRAHRAGEPVVVGLLRGGVPVAYEIARALGAPLALRGPRAPREPARRPATTDGITGELDREGRSDAEDLAAARGELPEPEVRGREVILVADALVETSAARAVISELGREGAGAVVLAVPVGSSRALDELASLADEIVCLHPEDEFDDSGRWYERPTALDDETLHALLSRARGEYEQEHGHEVKTPPERGSGVLPVAREGGVTRLEDVRVKVGGLWLEGQRTTPPEARGLVVFFPRGGKSSAEFAESQYIAGLLHHSKLATLRVDLLTAHERERESDLDAKLGGLRTNVELLASRLVAVTDWIAESTHDIGYFGAGVGGAVALAAAARRPAVVRAVVVQSGLVQLAESSFGRVRAPTLLLVGGLDADVLRVNRETLYFLRGERQLEIVHDAGHDMREPGAAETAARLAVSWFERHLHAAPLSSSA